MDSQGPRHKRNDFLALAFLFLIALLFYGHPLLTGRTYFYRDISIDFQPLTAFLVHSLQRGEFPIWNPLSASGFPQLASLQPPYFYPPQIIFYWLPYAPALTLFLVLHGLLAGCYTYALGRFWRWQAPAALVAALIYMMGGVMVSFTNMYFMFAAGAYLPGLILALERATLTQSVPGSGAFLLLLALQWATGRPDMALMTMMLLGAFVLERGIAAGFQCMLHQGRTVILGMAGAFLLNALTLFPAIEFLQLSNRYEGIGFREGASFSFAPLNSVSLLIPGIFGGYGPFLDWGKYFIAEPDVSYSWLFLTVYPGLAAYLLAPFAFRRERNRAWLLLLVAGGAFLLALGKHTPVYYYFQLLPTVNLTRHPVKYFYLFQAALALLAGQGMAVLLKTAGDYRKHCTFLLLLAITLFLTVKCLAIPGVMARLAGSIATIDFGPWLTDTATDPAINAWLVAHCRQILAEIWLHLAAFASCLLVYSLLCLAGQRGWVKHSLLVVAWPAALATDLVMNNGPFLYTTTAAIWQQTPPLVGRLNGLLPPSCSYRIYRPYGMEPLEGEMADLTSPLGSAPQDVRHRRMRERLTHNTPLAWGLPMATVYHSLRVRRSPSWLMQAAQTQNPGHYFSGSSRSILSVLGIRSLIAPRIPAPDGRHWRDPPDLAYLPAWKEISVAPHLGFRLYDNPKVLPRAFLVPSVRVVKKEAEAVATLLDPRFDARTMAVVEEDAALHDTLAIRRRLKLSQVEKQSPVLAPGSTARVSLTVSAATRVLMTVASDANGYLVLMDSHYPGWQAAVNGQKRPIMRANGVGRAVYVEAGSHRVEFRFNPLAFWAGLLVAASTLVVLGVALATSRKGRS